MSPRILALVVGLLAVTPARAEDSVSVVANYYKERSTRVVSPFVTIRKDLPSESELSVTYLVDQITSASGAFTPTDAPFQEYRQEVRASASKRFFGALIAQANARYSHEGDYRSLGYGLSLTYQASRDTTLSVRANRQNDVVLQRGRSGFRDTLDTTLVGASWTQVLRRDLVGGLNAEAQLLDGYTENPYRVEQHPRERHRYSLGAWGAYRHEGTGTTLRLDYCYYRDDWRLVSHSVGAELWQRLSPSLEIVPRFRFHTQSGVYFTELTPDQFVTTDPKLAAFGTRLVGLRLNWRLDVLADAGPLSVLARAQLSPQYHYFFQDNRYGNAHIASVSVYWPF